ncbi:hypothetical protein HBA55_29575 [Pseudomaricurvus alkylphenolicus]|uniref:hypothetical protein n=1 Tax=Pseudomaricurvus alkylphenolicus TaxID=1306991 RepID=UPI00142418A3|nr:hypothetical protein [Pseudomaricurvus alkylphenolicus]NIB43789.1 hypothetical protein [Pseudomaricurvus alkylphenolicus]
MIMDGHAIALNAGLTGALIVTLMIYFSNMVEKHFGSVVYHYYSMLGGAVIMATLFSLVIFVISWIWS